MLSVIRSGAHVVGTAGNVADMAQAHPLLHRKEIFALGDAGYRGVEKRDENQGKSVTWHVAIRPGKRGALLQHRFGWIQERTEKMKANVRAKVEHPFHVVKNLFKHRKTRYKGLATNNGQLFSLFAMANLVLAGRRLVTLDTRSAS